MGHYCRICGRSRPNEQFSGRGHRIRVCATCQRMPREKRERMERFDELQGFLHQSMISAKNVARLNALSAHEDHQVAELATLILKIARLFPGKRNRWLKLARHDRPLFNRAVELFGVEFFEDLLAGYGDFESPLWHILTNAELRPRARASSLSGLTEVPPPEPTRKHVENVQKRSQKLPGKGVAGARSWLPTESCGIKPIDEPWS